MLSLTSRIAVVAGATRGAGRGIACMLGEAGATVYCTGRSTREQPASTGPYAGRPETIEETAEMVTSFGGKGVAVRTNHLVEQEVRALFQRVEREQGRLDILVNDISEGEWHDWQPFWNVSLEKGFRAIRQGVHTHIITSYYAVPLMISNRSGLIVEIGDGDTLDYRGTLFYDLVKTSVNRFAYVMAYELRKHKVAALAVTPGYMRTEAVLDHFGVAETNWRDAARKDKLFLQSETPYFVGRAIAALAADPNVIDKSGGLYSSWALAREYGFTDVDGTTPDLGKHLPRLNKRKAGSKLNFKWTISAED